MASFPKNITHALQHHKVSNFLDLESIDTLESILAELPNLHYYTLEMVIRFLVLVTQYETDNKMGMENLIMMFAPNIMRCPSLTSSHPSLEEAERLLVENVLLNKPMKLLMSNVDSLFVI